jgi:hypothetical protein
MIHGEHVKRDERERSRRLIKSVKIGRAFEVEPHDLAIENGDPPGPVMPSDRGLYLNPVASSALVSGLAH